MFHPISNCRLFLKLSTVVFLEQSGVEVGTECTKCNVGNRRMISVGQLTEGIVSGSFACVLP